MNSKALADLEKAEIRAEEAYQVAYPSKSPPAPTRPDTAGHREPTTNKSALHLIIEIVFALVIAAMMLSMGAAFCVKFLRWAIW